MSVPARAPNRQAVMRDEQLTARHRLLVEYMLHGVSHASLCERATITIPIDTPDGPADLKRHPRVGEPLDLIAAADILRIKRRNARSLSMQPAFQRLLAKETAAFRDGARARATRRLVALIDEPGQGKAADRKVQLSAAQAVLGEGASSGITVNVNTGTQITAGIVVRLPALPQPVTIDHEDTP